MSQTEYSIAQAAGRVGLIADSSAVKDVYSYTNPAAEVKFGHVVTKGAATDEVVHPNTAAKVTDEKLVRGIVVASHECESVNDSAVPGYVVESVVPVMRKGRIWTTSEDACSEGTSGVFVRIAASSPNNQLGSLRATSDTTFTAILPKSKWKSSTSGTYELAVLEIDL